MSASLRCGRFALPLDRPLIMGVVNLTTDSFSGDGLAARAGNFLPDAAIAHAHHQIAAGADILDLGAESSRPGANPVPEEEELVRLLPVVRELAGCGVPVSVDTCKPAVMRAVLAAGASMINDIGGLQSVAAVAAVAESDCAVCIMHMQGEPRTMQQAPAYGDVVSEVQAFLEAARRRCHAAGIGDDRLVMDPGFGFGKTLDHNLALFRRLAETVPGELPILAGVSRKSMLGQITGRPVAERDPASIVAATLLAQRGARILRVHDVAGTRDGLAVLAAVQPSIQEGACCE